MRTAITTIALAAAFASAGPGYTVHDLGALGIESEAFAVNSAGDAVGMSYVTIQAHHAVRFDDPAPVPLLGPTGFNQSQAADINDAGMIAAFAFTINELGGHTLLIDGLPIDLGELIPRAIDAQGRIVGARPITMPDGSYLERAAWWDGASIVDLPAFGGSASSIAQDIDPAGVIVGSAIPSDSIRPSAVMWSGGGAIDLGTLGGASAQALAMNNSGDIVGVADTTGGSPHAFLFHVNAGVVTERIDLGFVGGDSSAAYDVNNARQAVGASHGRAFLWDNGVMHDLNGLVADLDGWELQSAHAINDQGVIVGHGVHKPFGRRAFMLTLDAGCPADLNGDGILDLADVTQFISAFTAQEPAADLAEPFGVFDLADVQAFVASFLAGCP